VQATDGTLYLLRNGARLAIAVDPVGDEELAAYSDGGVIGGSQLLALVALNVLFTVQPIVSTSISSEALTAA
jgi:phosphomannomutase